MFYFIVAITFHVLLCIRKCACACVCVVLIAQCLNVISVCKLNPRAASVARCARTLSAIDLILITLCKSYVFVFAVNQQQQHKIEMGAHAKQIFKEIGQIDLFRM